MDVGDRLVGEELRGPAEHVGRLVSQLAGDRLESGRAGELNGVGIGKVGRGSSRKQHDHLIA